LTVTGMMTLQTEETHKMYLTTPFKRGIIQGIGGSILVALTGSILLAPHQQVENIRLEV
jgi:hypothetical protein